MQSICATDMSACVKTAKASRDHGLDSKRSLGLAAIESQRKRLEELRSQDTDRPETYLLLREELDFRQVWQYQRMTSEGSRKLINCWPAILA